MRSVYDYENGELTELDVNATECADCGQSLADDEMDLGICGSCVYTEIDPNDDQIDPDFDHWLDAMLAPFRGGEECFD